MLSININTEFQQRDHRGVKDWRVLVSILKTTSLRHDWEALPGTEVRQSGWTLNISSPPLALPSTLPSS